MKNKINAVLSLGAFILCLFSLAVCQSAFADDPAQPRVQIGAVAQRYPWNGMVDVKVRVSGVTAEAGATLTVTATVGEGKGQQARDKTLVVATVTGVKNGEQTVSFNADDFDALKGKKLSGVKITAKVERGRE